MIDLNNMSLFAEVVRSGGYTAASRALGIPKSTLSRKISALEQELGARLLQRTTRQLRLTEVGAAYYERCRRIVADAQEAMDAVTQLQNEPQGTLRITAPPLFADVYLGAALTAYLKHYPKASAELVLTDRRVDLIEEGIDVAIRIGKLDDSSLIARKLGSTRIVCCASPEYLDRKGIPSTPDDLRDHDCLVFGVPPVGAPWIFTNQAGTTTIQPPAKLMVNSFPLTRDAAVAHLGIAVMPLFVCSADLEAGRLTPVLDSWCAGDRNVSLVHPSRQHVSAKVLRFIEVLEQHLQPTLTPSKK